MTTVTYAEFDAALARAKLGVGAAELHGSIAGYLCTGWSGPARELLAALELEGANAGGLDALLGELAAGISRQLQTGGGVMPLLPAAPLSARANGVVDWCRGFLGGLGLTGVVADAGLAPATRELLDAFAQIASRRIGSTEEGDAALAEVLDFIREGTAHLHATFAPADRR